MKRMPKINEEMYIKRNNGSYVKCYVTSIESGKVNVKIPIADESYIPDLCYIDDIGKYIFFKEDIKLKVNYC